MPRVVHFEFNADDPERAVEFYKKVFDWKVDKWKGPKGPTDYWPVMTGDKDKPGIDGAIMPRMGNGTTFVTIDVSSVDKFVKKIEEAGGKVVQPKSVVPGVGYFAYCADTEGNVFGIMDKVSNNFVMRGLRGKRIRNY